MYSFLNLKACNNTKLEDFGCNYLEVLEFSKIPSLEFPFLSLGYTRARLWLFHMNEGRQLVHKFSLSFSLVWRIKHVGMLCLPLSLPFSSFFSQLSQLFFLALLASTMPGYATIGAWLFKDGRALTTLKVGIVTLCRSCNMARCVAEWIFSIKSFQDCGRHRDS